jgi:hypothetical protein
MDESDVDSTRPGASSKINLSTPTRIRLMHASLFDAAERFETFNCFSLHRHPLVSHLDLCHRLHQPINHQLSRVRTLTPVLLQPLPTLPHTSQRASPAAITSHDYLLRLPITRPDRLHPSTRHNLESIMKFKSTRTSRERMLYRAVTLHYNVLPPSVHPSVILRSGVYEHDHVLASRCSQFRSTSICQTRS